MKSVKTPLIVAAVVATMASAADARHGSLYAARSRHGYDYHRRHRPNAIDLVSDMFSIPFYSTNSLFRQQQDQLARLEQNTAPRYSISQSEDGKFVELAMEVPGVPADELSVEVENGDILRIRGSRTIRESGSVSKTEFDQSFQLDKDIDVENISVSLSSGILTVVAPKKEHVVKRISLKIAETDPIKADPDAMEETREMTGTSDEEKIVESKGEEDFVITEDDESRE